MIIENPGGGRSATPRGASWAAALLCCLPVITGAGEHRVTPEDFVALKSVGSPVFSPDGRWVLYTVSAWDPDPAAGTASGKPAKKTHLWLIAADPSAGAAPRQLTFGEGSESGPEWSPDGRHVSFVTSRRSGSASAEARSQIWLLPMGGGEARALTDAPEGVASYRWSAAGRQIAYTTRQPRSGEEDRQRNAGADMEVYEQGFRPSHVWVVDVASGQSRQVTHGDFTVSGTPNWSPDGRRLAFTAKQTELERDPRMDAYIVAVDGGALEKVTPEPRAISSPQWSPDGGTLALTVLPRHGREYAGDFPDRGIYQERLALYDVARRTFTHVEDPRFDQEIWLLDRAWSRDGRRVLFTANVRVDGAVFGYDLRRQRFERVSGESLGRLTAVTFPADGSRAAYVAQSPLSPPDIFVAKSDFTSPRRLTRLNPQVDDWLLADAEIVRWKSPDGTEVEGLLYKPVGYEPGKRYPMVVDVHGGPMFAHTRVFKGDAQFWAGQGWAVLYPNPRGSTCYGERFLRANLLDWGGGDYADIMSGVDAVIARGVADPDRLAVMGWSFGGYMTAWIVSQSSRFKAAMMGAGVSNLASMFGTSDVPNLFSTFLGGYPDPQTGPLYQARSALTFADQVTTPLLILHGKSDVRVPPTQAMEFYRALKVRNKPVELVLYPRAGHGVTEYRHQLDRYWRQFRWIERYTLGKTEQGAAPGAVFSRPALPVR